MVMAQALFHLLTERSPTVEVHVLAPSWCLPILKRMPEVSRGIELGVKHGELQLAARRALGHELRSEGYDQAVVLPRSLKASLVPFFARIPTRTGFRGEWRFGLINDMRTYAPGWPNQTVLRFMALGLSVGEHVLPDVAYPSLRVDASNLQGLLDRLELGTERPVIALMPGAEYGPAKRWPLAYFGELAKRLAGAGMSVWILGSAKERPVGVELKAIADHPHIHNLCGASTLTEVIDLLAVASVAVTNDSGLMHVAAAVGTHVIAIYGSTSPDFTPPLTDAKTVCYEKLSCSPCFERTCPLRHLNCLREISVDAVFDATLTALGRRDMSLNPKSGVPSQEVSADG